MTVGPRRWRPCRRAAAHVGTPVMQALLSSRVGSQMLGSAGLFAVLVLGGLLYASGGTAARDILVTQMLINATMVIGPADLHRQTPACCRSATWGSRPSAGTRSLCWPPPSSARRGSSPDVPLGLDDVSLNPLVARGRGGGDHRGCGAGWSGWVWPAPGAKSGAVAATVITLALLFMVHEVGGAYADLTGGRNGISFSVGRGLDSRLWIYLAPGRGHRRRSAIQGQPHRPHGPGRP